MKGKKLYEEFLAGMTSLFVICVLLALSGAATFWVIKKLYWSQNPEMLVGGLLLSIFGLVVTVIMLSLTVYLGRIVLGALKNGKEKK
ncbi:hypothetical protein CMI37_29305 [Candidatus Pacearchaeota archaeon]|jgi:tellurite resistance protein TehA-like permease|nr:hypothetical protein [Candidatus Pacearchaeota archaeon]|tara:strand:+ start:1017 stop:1277 length:261 start_codon:yes stop_codon:yes gene_type:complete